MQVQALDSGMLVVRGDQAAVPSRLQMIPMIVAVAAAGPVGGAAVAGGTSALSEFGSGIREFARDNGVDPSDKDGLGKLFSYPKMLREAMAYAGKGGAIVGTMDAVSGGLAGKTLVPKVFKNQAVRQAINAPLQAGVQAALGGAGEAGKQLAQKGQIDQPGQVLAEVVGELGGVHNPLQDTSARVADDGGRRAVDPPTPRVPAQTTAPAAPVGQPSTAAPNLDANGLRTVDSHSVEGGTHVLPDRHLDVSGAPTVPYAGVGTVAQLAEATGGQQTLATAADMHASGPQGGTALDSPADVSVAPFVGAMRLTDEGTLSVGGDPRALEAFLNKAGVDKVFLFDRSLLVAPEQAAQAQQALSPDAANALKRQPPPVQMKMREGGMLDVEGDTQAVRQWLEDAGIPSGAMTDGPEGVIVTAGSVERARQALAGHASPVGVVDTLPAEGAPVPFSQVRNGGIDSGPVAGDFSSERGDFHGNASGRASQGVSMGSQELQSKNGAPHAFGRISFQQGARPDANELRAGRSLADLGYNVIHKVTANDLGVPETPTADLEVEGIGQVDVYTPNTSEVKNIVREIERKKEQATSVLIQTDLDDASIQAIQDRFWGKPNALRIQSLFFQESGGRMIYVPRPKKGN